MLFPVIGYYFIALWALLGLLKVLFTILRNPFTTLKKTTRESEANLYFHSNTLFFCVVLLSLVPPACLLDPSLGSHEYVTANGLKFHCVCAGDTSKPLMLLLHGFPEVTTLTHSHTHTQYNTPSTVLVLVAPSVVGILQGLPCSGSGYEVGTRIHRI